MADTITLTSTTDTEAQVKTALGIPIEDVKSTVAEPVEATLPLEPADADAVEEAAADAAEPAAATHVQQQAAGKKRGRLQSRIDELVAERDRMRGLTSAQEAELTAYRKRVADLVALPSPPASSAKSSTPPATASAPSAKPKVEDFATYEDYTEAVAEWTVNKTSVADQVKTLVDARLKEEREKQEQAQQQLTKTEMQRRYATVEDTVKAKYEDYAEVINAPDLKASELMVDQMLRSDIGPEIAYYLGKHPEQCQKLYAMGNTAEALKHFGKIEARVETALETAAAPSAAGNGAGKAAPVVPTAGKSAKPAPVVTKAPDPITPVGAGAQSTTVDPSQMSYQDYRKYRNDQERAAGRSRY